VALRSHFGSSAENGSACISRCLAVSAEFLLRAVVRKGNLGYLEVSVEGCSGAGPAGSRTLNLGRGHGRLGCR